MFKKADFVLDPTSLESGEKELPELIHFPKGLSEKYIFVKRQKWSGDIINKLAALWVFGSAQRLSSQIMFDVQAAWLGHLCAA